MPDARAPAPGLTLVLGGARSGKSRHAEDLIARFPGPACYIATAEAGDDEMRERIAAHRAGRDPSWTTIEEPLALADVLRGMPQGRPVLVDCLTLWLSNVILAGRPPATEVDGLLSALADLRGPAVLIANEVGLGIVPDYPLGRLFRDEAGRLNQRIAAIAERVVFLAAGLPIVLKNQGLPGHNA